MHDICNSCGSPKDVRPCSHCPTLICDRCRLNHDSVCEQMQKRKSRGEGPTVIRHTERPPSTAMLIEMGMTNSTVVETQPIINTSDLLLQNIVDASATGSTQVGSDQEETQENV